MSTAPREAFPYFIPAGGIYSTPEDLNIFTRAFLTKEQKHSLFSNEEVRDSLHDQSKMTQISLTKKHGLYGQGFAVSPDGKEYSHNGHIVGSWSKAAYYHETDKSMSAIQAVEERIHYHGLLKSQAQTLDALDMATMVPISEKMKNMSEDWNYQPKGHGDKDDKFEKHTRYLGVEINTHKPLESMDAESKNFAEKSMQVFIKKDYTSKGIDFIYKTESDRLMDIIIKR